MPTSARLCHVRVLFCLRQVPFLSRQERDERNGRGEDSDFFPPVPLFETAQGECPLADPPDSENCTPLPGNGLHAAVRQMRGRCLRRRQRRRRSRRRLPCVKGGFEAKNCRDCADFVRRVSAVPDGGVWGRLPTAIPVSPAQAGACGHAPLRVRRRRADVGISPCGRCAGGPMWASAPTGAAQAGACGTASLRQGFILG